MAPPSAGGRLVMAPTESLHASHLVERVAVLNRAALT